MISGPSRVPGKKGSDIQPALQSRPNWQGQRATIAQVAERAGVSTATVSYVVNETRKVRPETRRRVLSAVQELGYTPNAAARNLVTGGSRILGIIVSSIVNPFFPEIITAFQDTANLRDMDAVVMNTNYDSQRLRNTVGRLLGLQVPGVAVLTSQIDPSVMMTLAQQEICAVYLDLGKIARFVSNIAVDYEHGIASALEHVRALGHTRIGFIGGSPNLVSAQRRRKAFVAGAEKAGTVQTHIVDSDFTVQGGYFACSRLLASFPATAILAANDQMAIGAMHCAYDRNMNVPGDLAVVGFDDITFAQFTQPALTTVAIPREEIGRVAFEALWAMMADPAHMGSEYCVETKLVIRQSTIPKS
jgi:DNA-binding LacI/PurR family transcriptional regulator